MMNNHKSFRPLAPSASARILLLATAMSAGMVLPAVAQTAAPSLSAPATAPAPVSDMFYTGAWVPTHWRASEAMGQAVYNRSNEKIGDIEELLIDANGQVMAAVVGVGGFLGMGERKVAVSYRSFAMARDEKGVPRLVVDLNKASLDKAPEYKAAAMAKRS
jgi:hypothetical protein